MTRPILIALGCYSSPGKIPSPRSREAPIYNDNRPNNHVVLDPISNSPLLKRLGLEENALTRLGQHLTMEQWVKARQSQQQRRTKAPRIDGQKYQYGEKELEIIPGLHAKVHN